MVGAEHAGEVREHPAQHGQGGFDGGVSLPHTPLRPVPVAGRTEGPFGHVPPYGPASTRRSSGPTAAACEGQALPRLVETYHVLCSPQTGFTPTVGVNTL